MDQFENNTNNLNLEILIIQF